MIRDILGSLILGAAFAVSILSWLEPEPALHSIPSAAQE
jgi:hypothetical protein